jgi:hypothetical protein
MRLVTGLQLAMASPGYLPLKGSAAPAAPLKVPEGDIYLRTLIGINSSTPYSEQPAHLL